MFKHIDPGAAMGPFCEHTSPTLEACSTNTFLIVLTVIFILLEISGFPNKLRVALGNKESSFKDLSKITDGIKRYMAIKTLTSLATGIFIGIWLCNHRC